MSNPAPSQQNQEATSSTTVTVAIASTDDQTDDIPTEIPTLHLKLRKPRNDRKVKWSNETVDNEHMNKKKSKCCCIYDKPKIFGESSSEDSDDECDHCHGHVEKKKKKAKPNEEGDDNVDSPEEAQNLTTYPSKPV